MKKLNFKFLGATLVAIIALNIAGNLVFKRFDLTSDHRYTLSETSDLILQKIDKPLYVDV